VHVLILGGTRFAGRAVVDAALDLTALSTATGTRW
jgi:hypothetical protein